MLNRDAGEHDDLAHRNTGFESVLLHLGDHVGNEARFPRIEFAVFKSFFEIAERPLEVACGDFLSQ